MYVCPLQVSRDKVFKVWWASHRYTTYAPIDERSTNRAEWEFCCLFLLLRRNKLRWITENLDIVGVVINCKSLTVICPSPTMQPPFLKVFSSSHPGMHLSMTWHDRTGGCPSRLTRTSTSALRTGFHYSLSLSLLHPTLLCHLWVSSTSMFWFSHSSLSCFRNPDQDLVTGM